MLAGGGRGGGRNDLIGRRRWWAGTRTGSLRAGLGHSALERRGSSIGSKSASLIHHDHVFPRPRLSVCSDHRHLQSPQQPPSALGQLTKAPRQRRGPVFMPCRSACVWILSFVLALGVCLFACLFACLRVWTVSSGGWWWPFFPLRETAAKKPGVCLARRRSLWPAARPEVPPAGAPAGRAHKVRSSGTRKARRGT